MTIIFIIGLTIIVCINISRITALTQKMKFLENRVKMLQHRLHASGDIAPTQKSEKPLSFEDKVSTMSTPLQNLKQTQYNFPETTPKSEPNFQAAQKTKIPKTKRDHRSLERKIFSQLPIWLGGIALSFAGFYLVKYSLENNLLSPATRIIMGAIFGFTLLVVSGFFQSPKHAIKYIRIKQALAGAGIAVLYASVFSATHLYNLVAIPIGFMLMASITMMAVFLSLFYGAPIALLGLLGGYLTPIFVGSQDSSLTTLLIYLYFLFVGFLYVILQQKWWKLLPISVLSILLWVVFSIIGDSAHMYHSSLSVFLLSICTTSLIFSKLFNVKVHDKASAHHTMMALFGISLVLVAYMTSVLNFSTLQLILYALLAFSSMFLAYASHATYRTLPWIALISIGIGLGSWQTMAVRAVFSIHLIYFIIFVGAGLWIGIRKFHDQGEYWLTFTLASAVTLFSTLAYNLYQGDFVQPFAFFWPAITTFFYIPLGWVLLTTISKRNIKNENIFILTIISLVYVTTISFCLELAQDSWPLLLAIEALIISMIYRKTRITRIKYIGVILGIGFCVFTIPQIIAGINRYRMYAHWHRAPLMAKYPLIHLAIPALLFFLVGKNHHMVTRDWIAKFFTTVAVLTITTMTYFMTRHLFSLNHEGFARSVSFLERSTWTNIVFVLGLGSFYLGQKLDMAILQTHAKWLFALAWVRILTFDVLVLNPIWSNAHVYGIVPINTLCITYLLPIFFTTQSLTRSVFDSKRAGVLYTFSFVLFFMWITTNIRFFFHPDAMMRGTTSHIEIYTYSIAYLLVSIGLLVYGLAEKHKGIRKASIALMTLTVSKVFLYDASNLTGMYRVLSFLGLGICLLTISFIYSKFIFKDET